jgi:AbrB family looped-hinge helix DNA binding protein
VVGVIREEMKVGPKGQVVIPRVFRKSLGIGPGSTVVFELRGNEILIEKPRRNIVKNFERIAKSGKSMKIKPHEYEEELEERWKKSRGKK